ncbi:DUF3558 family protein [Corynebacterium felinum]|uniref:DUF3558 domain-containing protein n=2 Tax=Corynebacterium felinum TaxID=131318 RepID=A0ABU2B786_9CORY|nr:DUF3558 family protein [Corynebacterium felinum]MDF5820300.1 DUF3558 family protein [Corynebacterium felinum]MDR7353638.1 hypothetical protein [Corynebacterium felinum]WJY95817.1 hypothetical protein CFELI_11110 [Corynebacterium felinum]
MNLRTAFIPVLVAACVFASGCADKTVSTDAGAASTVAPETQQPALPSETPQPASVSSMIPLPPDREYVEAFDPTDRTQKLYNPCDEFTAEDLTEMGLKKIVDTVYNGTSLIDCGMQVPHQFGVYNIDTHFATFEGIKSRGLMIDATFPDADDRVYFNEIGNEDKHCNAAVSTTHGRLSVVYTNAWEESLGRDELCRRAFEVLQKIRVKGGYK